MNISSNNTSLIANYSKILIMLNPFIPHFSSECLSDLSKFEKIENEKWPKTDNSYFKDEKIKLVIQINGKKRDVWEIKKNTNEETIIKLINENEKLNGYIKGKKIIKRILVPNKIINLIVK